LTKKEGKKEINEDSALQGYDAASLGVWVMGYPVMWHHIPEERVINHITENLRTQMCIW
jgi:hypothetical protein